MKENLIFREMVWVSNLWVAGGGRKEGSLLWAYILARGLQICPIPQVLDPQIQPEWGLHCPPHGHPPHKGLITPVSLLGAAELRARGVTEIPVSCSFSSPQFPSCLLPHHLPWSSGLKFSPPTLPLSRLCDSELKHLRKDRAQCIPMSGCWCPFKIHLGERGERTRSNLPFLPEIKVILSSEIGLVFGESCVSLLPVPGALHIAIPLLHAGKTNGEKEKKKREGGRHCCPSRLFSGLWKADPVGSVGKQGSALTPSPEGQFNSSSHFWGEKANGQMSSLQAFPQHFVCSTGLINVCSASLPLAPLLVRVSQDCPHWVLGR